MDNNGILFANDLERLVFGFTTGYFSFTLYFLFTNWDLWTTVREQLW
jgi:hypothetical protein